MISFQILSSGSNGNMAVVRTEQADILIDCGRNSSFMKKNFEELNIDPSGIDGALITHAHTDHINASSLRFLDNFGIPIYSGSDIFGDILERFGEDSIQFENIKVLDQRFVKKIKDISVDFFYAYHSDEKVSATLGFCLECFDNGRKYKIGYLTDTGKVCKRIIAKLADCNILAIEANYDEGMLSGSFRPQKNKDWILSGCGHLSNTDSAKAIADIKKSSSASDSLKYVFLSHISEEHNTPELSLRTVRDELKRAGAGNINLFTASRDMRSKKIIIGCRNTRQ